MKRILLLTLLVAAGCSKDEQADTPHSPDAPAPPVAAIAPARDPADVIMEVDGAKLTYGQAQQELGFRMASIQKRVPPDRLNEYRAKMFNNVVDQFMMRTVLLNEANRQNISVTPEDEAEALDKIRETLPPGLTPEDVMKNSPMGEERMQSEMLIGVKINKLLEKELQVDDAVKAGDVDKFIEENRERLTAPDSVTARHILMSFASTDDNEAKLAKKLKLEGLRKQLLDGADFAELAKENSDCPSAKRGGDLGSFSKGRMVPEFELAAFSQELNAIGDILKTKFGYHVIQITDRSKAGLMPREKIETIVKNRKQQELMTAYIETLKAKATIKDSR